MDDCGSSLKTGDGGSPCRLINTADVGILDATVLRTIAQSQSVRYSKWSVKHDKNREDEDEEDKPDQKRKRLSASSLDKQSAAKQSSDGHAHTFQADKPVEELRAYTLSCVYIVYLIIT